MSILYGTPYSSASPSPLNQWGNAVVGNWSIKSNYGTGSFTAAWNAQKTALQGTFQMGGFPSATWTTTVDPSSGKLVQNQNNSDGTKATITITPMGGNQFATQAACADQEAVQIGSSNTLITFSADGKTMTHQLSNQVNQGQSISDSTLVLTRV